MQATAQVIPFSFETREVRTMLIDDQPWFVAADVASSLEYGVPSALTRHLDDDEKGVSTVHTLGGAQEMLVINESGLYSAILRSRKAEAKRFKKWVTAEVLPAIRKHGRYHDEQGKMATLIGETIGTDGFHMLGALIKGKVAGLPAANQRKASAKIWSQTHAAFGVRSAADIPATQLDSARNFIGAYALEGEWLKREEPKQEGILISFKAAHHLHVVLYYLNTARKIWNQHRCEDAARSIKAQPLMDVGEYFREMTGFLSSLEKNLPVLDHQNAREHWARRPQ